MLVIHSSGFFVPRSSRVQHFSTIFAFCVSLSLGACAHQAHKPTIDATDIARYEVMQPEELLTKGEELMKNSAGEGLDYFAKPSVKAAEEALARARDLLKKKAEKAQIASTILEIEKHVEHARFVKTQSQTTLSKEIALKETLDNLGTPKIFAKEYNTVSDELRELFRLVETGAAEKLSKEQKRVGKILVDLELRTIKYNALSEAERILNQAKSADAEKYVPATFKEATLGYKNAEQTIVNNTHDATQISSASKSALFSAKHALHLAQRVRELEQSIKRPLEQLAVEEEQRLLTVGKAMGAEDVRDSKIQEQVDRLSKLAAVFQDRDMLMEKLASMTAEHQSALAKFQLIHAEHEQTLSKLTETEKALNDARAQLAAIRIAPPETPATANQPVVEETKPNGDDKQGVGPSAQTQTVATEVPNPIKERKEGESQSEAQKDIKKE